jgi:selenide, water dikinase
VTGFGLLGHLHHLCRESRLAAEIWAPAVPALEGVDELLCDDRCVSGGSRRNSEWASAFVRFDEDVPSARRRLLTDATTSGGLLAAVPAEACGDAQGTVIGRLVSGDAGAIRVRSA